MTTSALRTRSFRESVIRGMSRLAAQHGAINLAQGFPNFPAPELLKEAACKAIRADRQEVMHLPDGLGDAGGRHDRPDAPAGDAEGLGGTADRYGTRAHAR